MDAIALAINNLADAIWGALIISAVIRGLLNK
jgi:hypothetical protein